MTSLPCVKKLQYCKRTHGANAWACPSFLERARFSGVPAQP